MSPAVHSIRGCRSIRVMCRYPLLLPRGPARNTFTTLTSLLPGTVPIGSDTQDALVIHCLDVTQPVAAQLAAEEALLMRIIDKNPRNG